MKKNQKKIILFSIIIFTFLFTSRTEASSMNFEVSSNIVGIKEEFYVDLYLDTEGREVNGIEGVIAFPDEMLSLVRIEDGKSMVNLWVEKPENIDGVIRFSGIMTNGFSGVIDPFNIKKKLPGLILRFVLTGEKAGYQEIEAKNLFANLSDGNGTQIKLQDIKGEVIVQDIFNPSILTIQDGGEPEIEAYITKDPNLFNNKNVLVFNARDNNSGIREVLIKEGFHSWKAIESPYLLEDQSRRSIITIQVTNYIGVSKIITIDPVPSKLLNIKNIIMILIVIIIILFLLKKNYDKNKKN